MKVQAIHRTQADWLGVLCSVGCAIHCAATPIIVSLLPTVSSARWLADPLFHQVIAGICGVLVIRAILPGIKVHRDWRVGTLAAAGISLLFLAAFVLPDTCCSHLDGQPTTNTGLSTSTVSQKSVSQKSVSQKSVGLNRSKIAEPAGTFRFVSTQTGSSRSAGHDHSHAGHDHSHAGHDHSSHAPETSIVCEEGCCAEHPKHWGKTLFSLEQLERSVGSNPASVLASSQPYLSPFGGLLLIVAHILNIRLQCCTKRSCYKDEA